ncbi:MAG: MBL fold metallo-hydrolase [Bacteroidales bacterium]|jgi:7,8-dihydropterin-6-yl-methyl-4-(beta-D-ribofuranosyl)aminobenzene 5'-phosphate synthase|nr:MBL fold metallo-hydrolase [Bacteroidales bacterium]
MAIKITTLTENLVYKRGLLAEHGLSLFIETGTKKILFDTGQSDVFLKNAGKMGVKIDEIDLVIISHGHYDHTGGLSTFLKINSKAKVFLKKEALQEKLDRTNNNIGLICDPQLLENRVEFVTGITEVDKGLFIVPDIPVYNSEDTHFKKFNDDFMDELYLAIALDGELSIITGCSHRGITNIMKSAGEHFNLPLNLVLGGFHTKDCTESQFSYIIDYLSYNTPKSIGVCHCTGIERYSALNKHFGNKVFYSYVGSIFEI